MEAKTNDPIKHPLILGLFIFAVILVTLFGAVFYILNSLKLSG